MVDDPTRATRTSAYVRHPARPEQRTRSCRSTDRALQVLQTDNPDSIRNFLEETHVCYNWYPVAKVVVRNDRIKILLTQKVALGLGQEIAKIVCFNSTLSCQCECQCKLPNLSTTFTPSWKNVFTGKGELKILLTQKLALGLYQ